MNVPNELSTEIFNLSTPKPIVAPGPNRGNEFPWVLLRVCKRWRDLVLGTSCLWNNIHVDYDEVGGNRQWNVEEQTRVAKSILSKSKDVPLTLLVTCSLVTNNNMWPLLLDMMTPHFHRLKSLRIDTPGLLLESFLKLEPIQFDCLEYLSLGSEDLLWTSSPSSTFRNAHYLRHIEIQFFFDWRTNPLPWSQLTHISMFHRYSGHIIHDFLRVCSALVFLYIKVGKFDEIIIGRHMTVPIHLSFLTTLKLMANDIPEFLRPLILPHLTQLDLISSRSPPKQPTWNPATTPLLYTFRKLSSITTRICIPASDTQLLLKSLPYLTQLKIRESAGLFQETLTSLADGSLASRLEILHCCVNPHTLESHLLMLEQRALNTSASATIVGTLLWDWTTREAVQTLAAKRYGPLIAKLRKNGLLIRAPGNWGV
ncbi:hypothetical protein BDZ94DRAFT_1270969 [Collybia nuda]|uniref:F-box domain-containing protein n=1 Tax=Collybia nuda TaxID=64659 RepID=A0A9P6CER5_9AGAR|nr:hypothetical protein BDZ94DRAFT_1270969 [Collybia nuda]